MAFNTNEQLCDLLKSLIAHPQETEWIEFKQNNIKPDVIGQNLSALAKKLKTEYASKNETKEFKVVFSLADEETANLTRLLILFLNLVLV